MPVRWVVYVCLPLGTLVACVGVYGDSQQWWEHRNFLTNLVSSVTGLLFGAPTALIVLSNLGDAQTQAREERKFRAVVGPEVLQLEALLVGRFDMGLTELKHQAISIRRALDEDRNADFQRYNTLMGYDGGGQVSTIGPDINLRHRKWKEEMVAQWEVIDGGLRTRAVAIGVEWLPSLWSIRVREHVRRMLTGASRVSGVRAELEGLEWLCVVTLRLKELHVV
ncbi:hypothetical protein [Streptomyces sp. NPDC000878]